MDIRFIIGLLIGCLIGAWWTRRSHPATSGGVSPANYNTPDALDAFVWRVSAWINTGRISRELGLQVRDLLEADRLVMSGQTPAPETPPAPPPPIKAVELPVAAPAFQEPPVPVAAANIAASAPTQPEQAPAPPSVSATPPAFAAPPAPTQPARRHLLGALMALCTRRTLLFLGSFLLALSALTLVIFNWASFAPIVQLGLLAGVTAGLWAGGAWMTGRSDLATAGRNLEAVASLLVPVVAFATTRPGLLALDPRSAWLLVSLLSLPIYLIAAWRSGRGFYSTLAAIAGVSALLAGLRGVEAQWLATPVALLLCAYLALGVRLRASGRAGLAAGPYWVAQAALPISVVAQLALVAASMSGLSALAATLAAATLFYLLPAALEGRAVWAWIAAGLAPLALGAALNAAHLDWRAQPPIIALFALLYLGLAVSLERRRLPFALPAFSIAPLLAALALMAAFIDLEVARTTILPLIVAALVPAVLVERGRLAWLPRLRGPLAVISLAGAALLLPYWGLALLDLSSLNIWERVLLILPLGSIYYAGAYWWPGRLRRGYDLALQSVATIVVVLAGGFMLIDWRLQLIGIALVTATWLGQTLLRRHEAWATLALGSLLLGAFVLLDHSIPDSSSEPALLLGAAVALAYVVSGGWLRHGALRCFTWPALGWAGLTGIVTLGLAFDRIYTLGSALPAHIVVLLGLAASLAFISWSWRQTWPGAPVGLLLIGAVLLSAARGFFTGWMPATGDLAYVACATALALALLGQGLRRFARAYAYPYELLGLALLTIAPLMAANDRPHLVLTWLAMATLYGLATWRYRERWLLAAAFIAADLALLQGTAWLFPGGRPSGAGLLLLGMAWVQGAAALLLRHRLMQNAKSKRQTAGSGAPLPSSFVIRLGLPAYVAAALSASGALVLGLGDASALATIGLGLAVLLGLLASVERIEPVAWVSLALLALGLENLQRALGLDLSLRLSLGLGISTALYLAGWGLDRLSYPTLQLWHMPLRFAPLISGVTTAVFLLDVAFNSRSFGYLSLALGGLGLLVGLVARRERLPWLIVPALLAWDLAALSLAHWYSPQLRAEQLAPLMIGLSWAQGLTGIWMGRHVGEYRLPLYVITAISGAIGLVLAIEAPIFLAITAISLTLLSGLIASLERSEPAAWGSVALLGLGLWQIHVALDVAPLWSMSWLVIELVGVVLVGWGMERLVDMCWRRPTSLGPLIGALALSAALVPLALAAADLAPLTFALASFGLLLSTLAVRLRSIEAGYMAGAALVGSALCQLGDWGVRELQGYVLPAGIYLMVLADGLRRFQGQRRVSQVVEAGAALLLLGATFGQALRDESGMLYELLLFGESLLIIAYGVLLRLRVPFGAGVGFFVAGVLWMCVETVQITNQWLFFGSIGLLMLLAYVLLEHYQERLLRTGRMWMSELRTWG